MRYRSLIFDIDGTLWDSRSLVAQGYNQQLKREGMENFSITQEELTGLFGKVLPEISDILFADLPKEERMPLILRCAQAQDQFMQENPCQVGYPGVLETVKKLSETHRLFIVSNSEQGYPELCMGKLGLTPYFEDHLCYGDTHTSKGRTILSLIERCHIEDPVYIGDTQGDYEATLEAHVPFIWAAYGFGKPEGYTHKIDQISDLLNL